MTTTTLFICLYRNGEIVENGLEGVEFRCNKTVLAKIDKDVTFDALKEVICKRLKLQKNEVIGRIIYPMPNDVNPIRYICFELESDDDVQLMGECHMQFLGGRASIHMCVEIILLEEGGPSTMLSSRNVDAYSSSYYNNCNFAIMQPFSSFTQMLNSVPNINFPPPPTVEEDEEVRCASPHDPSDDSEGIDLENDVPAQYVTYFIEEDDEFEPAQPVSNYVPLATHLSSINTEVGNDELAEQDIMYMPATWDSSSHLRKCLIFPDKDALVSAIKQYSINCVLDHGLHELVHPMGGLPMKNQDAGANQHNCVLDKH